MLLEMQSQDPSAVRRHNATILDCLKDLDPSIRRRALELTVAIIDSSNVRLLVPDLISYLGACGTAEREDVARLLASVVHEKAPNAEWEIEISLRFFKVAKEHAPVQFAINFIGLVSRQSEDIQRTAVQGLWEEVSAPLDASMINRHAFHMAATWCLGEYCSLLCRQGQSPESLSVCIANICNNTSHTPVKQYSLTSLMKISSTFPAAKPIAMAVFDTNAGSLDCELQQRACEFATMLELFGDVAAFSFSPMPPIECVPEDIQPAPVPIEGRNQPPAPVSGSTSAITDDVKKTAQIVIDDLFAITPVASTPAQNALNTAMHSTVGTQQSNLPAEGKQPAVQQRYSDPADIFGPSVQSNPTAVPSTTETVTFEAFRCNDFVLNLTARFQAPRSIHVDATIANTTGMKMTSIAFHVAVPKTCSVEVLPIPSSELDASQSMTQKLVTHQDPTKARSLLLRIKIAYIVGGQPREQLFQVSKDV
jgi:AP-1 complex subunit gamma-1